MAGVLLRDVDIVAAIDAGEISVTHLVKDDSGKLPLTADSAVQASSLDLSIGRIFVPPASTVKEAEDEPEGETGYLLEPGHTVVVRTKEVISLGDKIAAFGFPPSRLAKNSILMTNPGHVDPGYTGHLHFTLINMGREAYSLKQEAKIVSLLIFRFSEPVGCDFSSRNPAAEARSSIAPLLERLSPDFASFGTRMESSAREAVSCQLVEFERHASTAKSDLDNAKATLVGAENKLSNAENKFKIWNLWVSAGISLFVAVITVLATQMVDFFGFATLEDLDSLDDRVIAVEANSDLEAVRRQLEELEDSLAPLLKSAEDGE